MSANPYKFLESFKKDDLNIFFGRDREIEELYQKINESQILLVYGISGVGKTSIINCGLANKFDTVDCFPVHIRRGGNINKSWINSVNGEESLESSVKSKFHECYKPLFFIFDQFEELFIFGNKFEINEFITNLETVVSLSIPTRIILVIREEYLAHLSDFEKKIPDIFKNRLRITHISIDSAKESIIKPLEKLGIKNDYAIADEITNQMITAYQIIELTYLQIFLYKFYEFASENKTNNQIYLSRELLNKFGKVDDKINEFLTNEFINKDSGIIKRSLILFVSSEGTTQSVKIERLKDFLGNQKELVETVLKGLDSIIIKTDDQIELKHDVLARAIYNDSLKIIRDLHFLKRQLEYCLREKELIPKDLIRKLNPYKKHYLNFFEKKEREAIRESEKKSRIFKTGLKFFSAMILVFLAFIIVPPSSKYFIQKQQDDAITKKILKEYKETEGYKDKYKELQKRYLKGRTKDVLIESQPQFKNFRLDITEVTVEEFQLYCSEMNIKMPPQPKGYNLEDPVVNVNFTEVWGFAKWCGKRLPTMEEMNYTLSHYGNCISMQDFKKEFEWTSDRAYKNNVYFYFLKPVSFKIPNANYYLQPHSRKHFQGLVGFRCARDIK